jgi:hypothetical protein
MVGCCAIEYARAARLEQQVRCAFSDMIWTLFRQWDARNEGPVFNRRRHDVERGRAYSVPSRFPLQEMMQLASTLH